LSQFDRTAIAQRLRGLIAGQDNGDLAKTAARLGVEEVSLRMSVDDLSPHPTVEVLAAVIREYGVDPHWLLTGDYDPSRHRTALENDAAVRESLRDLMISGPFRIAELPLERNKNDLN
jgi:hypothetical protein